MQRLLLLLLLLLLPFATLILISWPNSSSQTDMPLRRSTLRLACCVVGNTIMSSLTAT